MPILDLSYRGYDGPLASPRMRWWVIAKALLLSAFSKRSFWVLTAFSGAYYLILMAILFFVEQFSGNSPAGTSGLQQFLSRVAWKDQFVHGLSIGQIWYLMIALLVGAGSIANDNRANALLVYLSKPCTKADYVIGKFVGIFLAMLVAMAIPTLFFLAYGGLGYRSYGFFKADPWMWAKVLAVLPISAAFHAALVLGISSMFRQGRVAGATYAGIYFLTNFFTQIITIRWASSFGRRGRAGTPIGDDLADLLAKAFYASIDGIHIGLYKAFLGTDGSPYFGIPSPIKSVPAPPLGLVLGATIVLSVASLAIAWSRVRAVEVVG